MTVNAHIMTTRVTMNGDSIALNFSNEGSHTQMVDVWFVTLSESLSGKTSIDIQEILDIRDYGVWITTPYDNLFWIVTYLNTGFTVKEFPSAELNNVYSKLEIESLLSQKADINHTHQSNHIIDLDDKINENIESVSDDINLFIDDLIYAFNSNGEINDN